MRIRQITFTFLAIVILTVQAKSQNTSSENEVDIKKTKTDYKYFIRTSYYSFTNWNNVGIAPNIYFYELHLGKVLDAKNKVGIINFDAHFDLRPIEKKPNSGTPFNQILTEFENVKYFAIGIQRQANTKELFNIARNENINFAVNYDCESSKEELNALKTNIQTAIDSCDHLYITIDLDGFSSAYAPGVSAPSPLGFTPYFVFKMLDFLFDTKKVISFDIAELNPTLDRDNITANLAAKLVDFIVMKLENE